jgi:hypothetical protein
MCWKWNVLSTHWCGPHPLIWEGWFLSIEQWLWIAHLYSSPELCQLANGGVWRVHGWPSKYLLLSKCQSRHGCSREDGKMSIPLTRSESQCVAPPLLSFTLSPSLSLCVFLCERFLPSLFACQCATPPHHNLCMVHSGSVESWVVAIPL